MDRFLGPGGWSDDPRGAEVLLRTSARSNEFFVAREGQWVSVQDQALREKAMVWVLRPAKGAVRFTGLLAVDEEMEKTLLRGVDFDLISETEFLVAAEDGIRTLSARIKEAGGKMQKGLEQPDPPEPSSREKGAKAKIARIIDLDAKALRSVERGDSSVVADFRDRGQELRDLVEESRASGGISFDNELMIRAGSEERMRVLLGEAAPGESAVLLSLLQQLQMLWQESGTDASWSGKEIEIALPEGTIVLGEKVVFIAATENSESSKKA